MDRSSNRAAPGEAPRRIGFTHLNRVIEDCAGTATTRAMTRLVCAISGQPASVARLEIERAAFLAGDDQVFADMDGAGGTSTITSHSGIAIADASIVALQAMGYQVIERHSGGRTVRDFATEVAADPSRKAAAWVLVVAGAPHHHGKPTLDAIALRGNTMTIARFSNATPEALNGLVGLGYLPRRVLMACALVEGPDVRAPQPADQGFMMECLVAAQALAKRNEIALTFQASAAGSDLPFDCQIAMPVPVSRRDPSGERRVPFAGGSVELLRFVRSLARRQQAVRAEFGRLMARAGVRTAGGAGGGQHEPL